METNKSKIKGPTMPPSHFDLDKIAQTSVANLKSSNWLCFDTESKKSSKDSNYDNNDDEDEDIFSSFGKSFKKPKDDKKIIITAQLEKIQMERELNPYWKDGGTGLPENENSSKSNSKTKVTGDGGLNWWNKALERCHEQAKIEGRSVEEIASERYGSLEALMDKINQSKELLDGSSSKRNDNKFLKPSSSSSYKSHGDNKNRYMSKYNDYNVIQKPNWRKNDESKETTKKSSSRERSRSRSLSSGSSSSSSSSSSNRESKKKKKKSSHKKKNSKSKHSKRKRSSSSSISSSSSKSSSRSSSPSLKSSKTSNVDKLKSKEPDVKINKEEINDKNQVQIKPKQDDYSYLDINELGAKLVKAELMGDETQINKIKSLMEIARQKISNDKETNNKNKSNAKSEAKGSKNEMIIVPSKTDRFGNDIPLSKKNFDEKINDDANKGKNNNKKLKNKYSSDGKRDSYFADDHKYSLKDLVEKEKQITNEDNNLMFSSIKIKTNKMASNDDFDDDVMDKIADKQLDGWSKIKVLGDQKAKAEKLNNCEYCFENYKKHLVVSIGSKSYLALPSTKSLVEGHCLIIPMQHYISSLMVDEDVWQEMNLYRKALVEMFKSQSLDCIFIEQFINEKDFDHMFIECIPLDMESGSLAPMYFKKALLESESEWAQNKQIINLKGKGIRKSIPKGLPYFSVEFGLDDGLAHVIENKNAFPKYFAKEIIGGILDLEPNLWRRAIKEDFSGQRTKVLNFTKYWKSFDFNK